MKPKKPVMRTIAEIRAEMQMRREENGRRMRALLSKLPRNKTFGEMADDGDFDQAFRELAAERKTLH